MVSDEPEWCFLSMASSSAAALTLLTRLFTWRMMASTICIASPGLVSYSTVLDDAASADFSLRFSSSRTVGPASHDLSSS